MSKSTRVTIEHRITWKRVGNPPKSKRCARRSTVERFLALLGPEPWRAFKREPDELFCCSGHDCGCGGDTVRDHFLGERKDLPPIEWIKVDSRMVETSPWVDTNPIARSEDPLGVLAAAVSGSRA